MDIENLIPAGEFCSSHRIEVSFINSLGEYGLIEIIELENTSYLHLNQLQKIEKYLRLYYDMDINIEGIEAISHLLERMNELESEIISLKNRLERYEV